MKTFLIIAALVIFLVLFSRRNRKKVSNPVDTILFGSCMGFKIGDGKKFVLSRINHLNLMNKDEKERYDLEEQMGLGTALADRRISTSDSLFNNIKAITFR